MSNTKARGRTSNITRDSRVSEEVRPERVPMSGRRTRMELRDEELDPNFKYKWINDTRGMLADYKRAGYVHVSTAEGLNIGYAGVDSSDDASEFVSLDVGKGVTAYLMKQPIEYAREDSELKANHTNLSEESIYEQLNSENNGTYGKISIDRK